MAIFENPELGITAGTPGQGGLSKLFENKLFLQMLAGAGQDISAGRAIGPSLSKVTQQNIATQNYAKLLKKILSGEIEGGKMTMSDVGMKIDIPKSALELEGDPSLKGIAGQQEAETPHDRAIIGSKLPGGSGIDWAQVGNPFGAVNPSASPLGNLSGADLAGLTPQDISQVLQFKFTQEQFGQKKISDMIDLIYKSTLAKESLARTEKLGRPEATKPVDKPYPIRLHTTGEELTLREWNLLPRADKEYSAYVHTVGEGGRVMSKEEFEALDPTEREQFLRALLKDSDLEAGYTRIFGPKTVTKTPTPMNWTTATRELQKRYGKLDPTGMWVVTDELQLRHRKAQEFLDQFRQEKMHPLTAVNEAEKRANAWQEKIESRYFQLLEAAGRIKDEVRRQREIDKIKNSYHAQYKYIPSRGQ